MDSDEDASGGAAAVGDSVVGGGAQKRGSESGTAGVWSRRKRPKADEVDLDDV
jgi:hypothetical protein